MWKIGQLNTAFTNLSSILSIAPTRPSCANCQKELPKHGRAQRAPLNQISFWSLICQHCRQPHIVWNDSATIPAPREEVSLSQQASVTQAADQPGQSDLALPRSPTPSTASDS